MNSEFFRLIKEGQIGRVREMISNDPSLLGARDENGLGAYTVARYSRQDDIARLLIERGVQLDIFGAVMAGLEERVADLLATDRQLVNACSHDGWTPLHLAAFFGYPAVMEVLLANGADVHARSQNSMQNTPLHAAAAGKAAVETIPVLLAHGADVNARQNGGWTPLHGAAQDGSVESIELLLAHGADPAARADNNQTPLDMAMTKGHQAAASLLDERVKK